MHTLTLRLRTLEVADYSDVLFYAVKSLQLQSIANDLDWIIQQLQKNVRVLLHCTLHSLNIQHRRAN